MDNLENFNISDELVDLLRQMMGKDPSARVSSYALLNKFRGQFVNSGEQVEPNQVKYSPVQTISRIELTVENLKDQMKENVKARRYSPEMNLSNRNQIRKTSPAKARANQGTGLTDSHENYFYLEDEKPKSSELKFYNEYQQSNPKQMSKTSPPRYIPTQNVIRMPPSSQHEKSMEATPQTNNVEYTSRDISPQKKMKVPEFKEIDSFRNAPKVNQQPETNQVFKVSHIDQFFKNKQSVNKEFYKATSKREGSGNMWDNNPQPQFTEEDFKKLEQKALPKDYMGQPDDDDLQFY